MVTFQQFFWTGKLLLQMLCQHCSDFVNITITQEKSWANIWQPSIKCLVHITFKLSKTIGRPVGLFFSHFFYIFNFFTPSQGENQKHRKRLVVICFVIQNHYPHYKLQKTPAEQYFIKLTCRLLFIFVNEANDPTSWMALNSIIHLSIKQSNIRY